MPGDGEEWYQLSDDLVTCNCCNICGCTKTHKFQVLSSDVARGCVGGGGGGVVADKIFTRRHLV